MLYGRNAGVRTVAVLYGYGDREELEAVQPDFLMANIAELPGVVARLGSRGEVP